MSLKTQTSAKFTPLLILSSANSKSLKSVIDLSKGYLRYSISDICGEPFPPPKKKAPSIKGRGFDIIKA